MLEKVPLPIGDPQSEMMRANFVSAIKFLEGISNVGETRNILRNPRLLQDYFAPDTTLIETPAQELLQESFSMLGRLKTYIENGGQFTYEDTTSQSPLQLDPQYSRLYLFRFPAYGIEFHSSEHSEEWRGALLEFTHNDYRVTLSRNEHIHKGQHNRDFTIRYSYKGVYPTATAIDISEYTDIKQNDKILFYKFQAFILAIHDIIKRNKELQNGQ